MGLSPTNSNANTFRITILFCFLVLPLLSNFLGLRHAIQSSRQGSEITRLYDIPPLRTTAAANDEVPLSISKKSTHRTTKLSQQNQFMLNKSLALEEGYCKDYKGKKSGPDDVQLSSDDFLLFHIGKAGGLTARTRLWWSWNIEHEQCHPRPEVCFNETYPDKYDQRIIFLTIRDPIDRFVSTNQWTLSKPLRGSDIKMEHLKIYDKYQPNPTATIAEQLCKIEGGRIRLDPKVIDDIHNLQHWWTIDQWLGETYPQVYDWKKHSSRLFPIVSERGFDLTAQEDTAILQVADQKPNLFGNAEEFEQRKRKAICYVEPNTHNSSAVMGSPPQLSRKAQLCLARFYQRDYQLLREVRDLACKSYECQLAIQSILDRRAELLSESEKLT
jgi:hypothetical protein